MLVYQRLSCDVHVVSCEHFAQARASWGWRHWRQMVGAFSSMKCMWLESDIFIYFPNLYRYIYIYIYLIISLKLFVFVYLFICTYIYMYMCVCLCFKQGQCYNMCAYLLKHKKENNGWCGIMRKAPNHKPTSVASQNPEWKLTTSSLPH